MTFEQKPEYIKRVSCANIWRHNIDVRGSSKSKYLEVGACLSISRGKQGGLCDWNVVKQGVRVGDKNGMFHGIDLNDVCFEQRGDIMC